jgi:hypothetical protein
VRYRRSIPLALSAILAVLPAGARATGTATPSFSTVTFPGAGGEPNVSVSPSGKTILVSGLGDDAPATLYRSTDYGAHFSALHGKFPDAGGGDWDMRWLDEHTIVAVDLGLYVIYVDRSTDGGLTWTQTQVLGDVYDRPWIDHFGTDKVYVAAKGFDGVPYLYTSTDGGKTFGTPPIPILVYGTGTRPAFMGGTSPTPDEALVTSQDAYLDHLTVDPRTGDVYVLYGIDGPETYSRANPVGVSNRLYVAHLENGAMVSHFVYLGGPTDSFISGFNWMTIDARGTLYVLANGSVGGHHSARLAYSTNRGRNWSQLIDLGEHGAANVYGSIAGGAPGVLSLVYLRGSDEDPSTAQNWYVEMARITGADTPFPSVFRTRPIAAPIHTQDICFSGILCGAPGFGNNRDLLDYIWNAVGPDGRAWAVVASDGPATGGHGVSVLLLRQTGGERHGKGSPS